MLSTNSSVFPISTKLIYRKLCSVRNGLRVPPKQRGAGFDGASTPVLFINRIYIFCAPALVRDIDLLLCSSPYSMKVASFACRIGQKIILVK